MSFIPIRIILYCHSDSSSSFSFAIYLWIGLCSPFPLISVRKHRGTGVVILIAELALKVAELMCNLMKVMLPADSAQEEREKGVAGDNM